MQKEVDIIPSWGRYVIALFVVLIVAYGVHSKGFCLFADDWDRYYSESPCFDFDYRCQVECGRYGLEFTGITDGCSCDCGTEWVSSCSGFYYDKESDDVIVRIPEDTKCYEGDKEVECHHESGVHIGQNRGGLIENLTKVE